MYSVRSSLLLKKYLEKHFIEVEEIRRIFTCKFKDLMGELIYYELPNVECRNISYRRKLHLELKRIKEVYDCLKYSRIPRDTKVNDLSKILFIDKRLFKYCSFCYNSLDTNLRIIIPEYLTKCERIIGDIQCHLIMPKDDYLVVYDCPSRIINIAQNVSSSINVEIAINTILSFCENNERLLYLMLLSRVFNNKTVTEIKNENVTFKTRIFS